MTLYVLVGIPASGKSSIAKQIKAEAEGNIEILSSDKIRGQLFGNERLQYSKEFLTNAGLYQDGMTEKDMIRACNIYVFEYLDDLVKNHLIYDYDVIYDATSITKHSRKKILEKFKNYYTKAICVFLDTPLEKCLENNQKRERKVPNNIIERYWDKLEQPSVYEGWREVWYVTERGISKVQGV